MITTDKRKAKDMNICEALDYIHNVKWQGSKPGLERTRELLKSLGNPEKKLKFVHVAGTNGKGSTSVCIASVLKTAGYKTGMFISPFVMCFNERIQINGEYISDNDLIELVSEIQPFADTMEDSPTEFEIVTALAFLYYYKKECDIVVLEVGMGGRLDSTNVIETPVLAVITSIGYDHVKELGPTLVDIAREKAGIIKNGGNVLIYGGKPEVESVFHQVTERCGAKLQKVDFTRIISTEISLSLVKINVKPYGVIMLPLVGTYQPNNALVAITALEILREKGYKISVDDIKNGIASVKWPGRFEILGHKPVFILDGSHNPQGMAATAESLKQHFWYSFDDTGHAEVYTIEKAEGDFKNSFKTVFILGVMADKDIDAMMVHIVPLAKAIFVVTPDNIRAMDSTELSKKIKRFGVPVIDCKTVIGGVSEALKEANENDVVCALGSFYFSAQIREAYNKIKQAK